MTPPSDPRAARAYLLGAASEAEADTVETEYFADAAALDAVAEAEEQLIDDFLAGRLAPDERARFESHYLASPRHRQRVAIARSLRARSGGVRRLGARRTWAAVGLALAATIVGMVAFFALRPGAGGGATLTLPSIALRGAGELPTLTLTAGIARVELRLERGERPPTPPLRAIVATVEGREVWRGDAELPTGAGADALAAIVVVPAAQLPAGDYVLSLLPADERYAFRIVRR